jgi:hypothetical protein
VRDDEVCTMTDDHEREAEWRWGNSDAFRESMKRTQRYGPSEWAQLKADGQRHLDAIAAAKRRGVAAESTEAMALAELHREYNARWFYETDHAMHAQLGQMYVNDPRFAATYDRAEPGLAEWFSRAIAANAKRAGAHTSIDDALANVRAAMGLGAAPDAPAPVHARAPHARAHAKRKR